MPLVLIEPRPLVEGESFTLLADFGRDTNRQEDADRQPRRNVQQSADALGSIFGPQRAVEPETGVA